MHALQSLILLGLPMAIVGSPAAERRVPTSPFGLYAYGDGIGGAPLFTTGDGAFIGKASKVGDTEAAPVEFEISTDNSLVGNPNATTDGNAPTWSNLTFNVPDASSSSHQVGFTNSTPISDRSGSGFIFYGQLLLHKNIDGSLKSLWYAVPSDEDGVWTLNWNSTGDESDGQIIVSLRATPPSREVDQAQ